MSEADIADLVARSQQAPEQRLAQRVGSAITELVHGEDAVTSAERISAMLGAMKPHYGGKISSSCS